MWCETGIALRPVVAPSKRGYPLWADYWPQNMCREHQLVWPAPRVHACVCDEPIRRVCVCVCVLEACCLFVATAVCAVLSHAEGDGLKPQAS